MNQMNQKKILSQSFSILALGLLSACFGGVDIRPTGGTDIGNPGGRVSEEFASNLNDDACDALDFCLAGFPEGICSDNGVAARGVGEFLGGPNTASLRDLQGAVDRKEYKLNSNALNLCRAAIKEVRCASLPLNDIWTPSDRHNFSRMNKFWEAMSSDCGAVVSPE